MNRLKLSLHELQCNIYYMFRPFYIIGISLFFFAAVFALFAFLYVTTPSQTIKDIAIAMITGVCASVPLTVIIEMAGNLRANRKRYIILSDLYRALTDYEFHIQLRTGDYDSVSAEMDFERKIHDEQIKKGDETAEEAWRKLAKTYNSLKYTKDDFIDRPNRVCAVFDQLQEIIPAIEKVRHEGLDNLGTKEASSIDSVYREYRMMVSEIHTFLLGNLEVHFGGNRDEMSSLIDWLPDDFKKKLNDSLIMDLSMKSWDEEVIKVAEKIVMIGSLPLKFMGVELKPTAELEKEEAQNEAEFKNAEVEETNSEELNPEEDGVEAGNGSTDSSRDGDTAEENDIDDDDFYGQELSEEEKEYLRKLNCSTASLTISSSLERIDLEILALTKIVKHEFGYDLRYNWTNKKIKRYGNRSLKGKSFGEGANP